MSMPQLMLMAQLHDMLSTILLVLALLLAGAEAFRPRLGAWAANAPHMGWLSLAVYLLAALVGTA
jgi:uncharacterized membrane protein